MNISRPFILRPVATSLLMVALVLSGLLGYSFLPVSALPSVDFPTIEVRADFPGASPEVMASSVTTPLERQFGQISGLDSMTSVSSFGHSSITLQFAQNRDIDSAAQDVQSAINQAGGVLPRGLPSPPVFSKVNPADPPVLTLMASSEVLPLEKVHDSADTILAQKLSQVPGVGLVTIQGSQKPAVRVRVNPALLAGTGVGMEDVRQALVAANANAPKGSFDGKRQAYVIGVNDQINSAKGFESVILAYRNNAPIRLSEVAEVLDDVENIRQSAWVDGKPAVLIDIQRQPGANIIETVDRIKKILPMMSNALPQSVKITVLNDRTQTIRASVHDVQFTMVLTIALVVLVIFLFLKKLWATVIPAVTLPLSILGTFGIMKLCGFSLNNLSLMALTISTGFVVDDAIVMIENIFRYVEKGESPLEAAIKGARQIGFTVISLSVSLIAVFIPLLFMQGLLGRLFREFAITLSGAVVVSTIISLTLTPMMCARLLKPQQEERESLFFRITEGLFSGVRRVYGASLRWVLENQFAAVLMTLVTLGATLWLFNEIPKGLLPNQDTGLIVGVTEAAPTISYRSMVERQGAMVQRILKNADVEQVASFVGGGALNPTVNSGKVYIRLKKKGERRRGVEEVMEALRVETADEWGITLFMRAVQDLQLDTRVSKTQYQITLQDVDEAELGRWAGRLRDALSRVRGFADVATDLKEGGLQLLVDIDRSRASKFNVTTQAVDDALYNLFGQRQVSVIFTQLNQYRVVLEADSNYRRQPEDLEKVFVKSSSGQLIPLSAIANVTTVTVPLSISHEGQFPAVTLSFNLDKHYSLGEAFQAIEASKQQIGFPDTIVTSLSGSTAEFGVARKSVTWLLVAAVVVIYIVLGVLYESYVHPITILSSLPSAGVGALMALMWMRMDLSVIAIIGIVLLIGIVKKNAIMMIDFALESQRERKMLPKDAIYDACLIRFRPIMMTTMAALLGALPMALEDGVGAELRRPLGITIVGGLVLSQFITLYTTPVIYLILDEITAWFRSLRSGGQQAAVIKAT